MANKKLKTIRFPGLPDTYTIPSEDMQNKVTSISSSSTDAQYPSAKAVYTLFENAKGGWTATQIQLLDDAAKLLRQLSALLLYKGPTTEGPAKAVALCDKLDELVVNLRGEQPTSITYEMRPDGTLRVTAAPADSYSITADGALKIL